MSPRVIGGIAFERQTILGIVQTCSEILRQSAKMKMNIKFCNLCYFLGVNILFLLIKNQIEKAKIIFFN